MVPWKQDANGYPSGRSNQNPIFDMCLYEVEFPGGDITKLVANIIAESMYAQCDVNGNEYLLLEAFVDHTRVRNLRKSTACWDICCKCKGCSTLLEKLSNLEESHPSQIAEYAIAQSIQQEPALNWWVHHVLKKRDRIISMVRMAQCSIH